MEERTKWQGQSESQIGEEKWQTFWCCHDQQRACRMTEVSAEKLEHTRPTEMERVASVPQREHLASTQEPLLPKEKGTYVRMGRKKALYRRERDSTRKQREEPHEEAEIQRKALGREKNMAFSEDTCLEKERVRLKVTPKKIGVKLKPKGS